MKRLASMLKKDIILGIKDIFLLLEVVFAVLFSLVLLVVIPEDVRTTGKAYIYDETKLVENFVTANVPDHEKRLGEYYVDSRAEVVEGMRVDRSAIGLIIEGTDRQTYDVQLLIQPYTKAGMIDYIDVDMEDLLSILHPPSGTYPADVYTSVRLEANQRGKSELIPFNQRLLPSFLVFNVGLLGLFAMVSLIGQERVDMTIRAYRLTPASLWQFLMSKHLTLLGVSVITFSVLYLPLMGFDGYLISLLTMLVTVVVMSCIGIVLASFYKGPLAAMGWVFVIMAVMALPVISLLNPVFSPRWLELIPSFHALFALDAAMFPDDNSSQIWSGLQVLSVLLVTLVVISSLIFSSRIRKEA